MEIKRILIALSLAFLVLAEYGETRLDDDSIRSPQNPLGAFLPEDYDIRSPPRIGIPLPVTFHVQVHDVLEMNDRSQTASIDVTVTTKWNEPRLLFNSKRDWDRNPRIKVEGQSLKHFLWTPKVSFASSETRSYAWLGWIFRNGSIIFERRMKLKTRACSTNFVNYPFDEGICHINVSVDDDSVSGVGTATVALSGFKTHPYYFDIKNVTSDVETSFIDLEIWFSRKIESHFWRFFVPTQVIVAISWISFSIPIEVVSGRIGLLITSLLILINLVIAETLSSSFDTQVVPYTASRIWSLACLFQIVLCLVEFAVILRMCLLNSKSEITLDRRSDSNMSERHIRSTVQRLDNRSAVFFPVISVIFNVAFWMHFLSFK